jgi:outer membrane protein TolC
VIPQANLALESSLISYQTGAVDFLSVLNNQLAVLEYQMNVHEEMQNYATAVSRLEEISGVSWME